jgi:hypothetical protein
MSSSGEDGRTVDRTSKGTRMNTELRAAALERLSPFVGSWRIEAVFPGAAAAAIGPGGATGQTTFDWDLHGGFLVQRTSAPDPAPDSLAVIACDPETGAYVQHYFDDRGVVRIYAMTFDGHTWTLSRTEPDFSPLDFSQRFTATFAADGSSINGAWEATGADGEWQHDFDLVYTRIAD